MVYSLGDRALRLGDKGDDVRQLQLLLQAAGYSSTVDGDFGLGTNAAVKKFQLANDLDADGVAGSQTIMLLQAQ
ncbi:MAG: peptidoglycan-binding domain-containing protein [Janthinobacterium lividum]